MVVTTVLEATGRPSGALFSSVTDLPAIEQSASPLLAGQMSPDYIRARADN
jgi:hypothetical protein